MTNNQNAPREATTPLLALIAWGRPVRFGNLIKAGGVNALYWYTVDLGASDNEEVYQFDAQTLIESSRLSTTFPEDIDESIRLAARVAQASFDTFAEFSAWVKSNYWRI